MANASPFRWMIFTGLIVAVLLGISALALDRPNVIWWEGKPQCPGCRHDVHAYSSRCADCGLEFDWVVAADEDSPLSSWSLSPLEEEQLLDVRKALGEDEVRTRVAQALGVDGDRAQVWLDALRQGRCGHCGGSGQDLHAAEDEGNCPVCHGGQADIASGGDRRMRRGDAAAARDALRLQRELAAIDGKLPVAVIEAEMKRLVEAFLADHAGTEEAAKVPYWKDLAAARTGTRTEPPRLAVAVARETLDRVLTALATAPDEGA